MTRGRMLFLLGLSAVSVIGALTFWQASRKGEDVRFPNGVPSGIILVTREEVFRKPMIDIPLPGGSRIQWPKPVTDPVLHNSFKAHPKASALLKDEAPSVSGQSRLQFAQFRVDGIDYSPYSLSPHMAVPYVYGDKPIEVDFRVDDSQSWVKMVILPNGKPPPRIKPVSLKLGPHTVALEQVGPLFTTLPVAYRVTVSNLKPNQDAAVTFSNSGGLFLCGQSPGVAQVRYWSTDPEELTLTIFEVKTADLEVSKSGSLTKIMDPGGKRAPVIER